jgi:hypothetical protein
LLWTGEKMARPLHNAELPIVGQPLKRIREADKDILLLSKQKLSTSLRAKAPDNVGLKLGAACDQ